MDTLKGIATHFVASDLRVLSNAVAVLPQEAFRGLLKHALETSNFDAAQLIICHWPETILRLSDLQLNLHEDAEIIESCGLERTSRTVAAFSMLAAVCFSLIDALEKRMARKLQVVDLRGFDLSGPTLKFLAAHALLAFNEKQHNRVLRRALALNQMVEDYSEAGFSLPVIPETLFTTLHPKTYTFYVDCKLSENEESIIEEVAKWIKVSQFNGGDVPEIRLVISRIHFFGFFSQQIAHFLEILDPMALSSLQLSGCDDMDEGNLELDRFCALQSLHIESCGGVEWTNALLPRALPVLPRLRHLSLVCEPLRNRLDSRVLQQLCQPLDSLRVDQCCLQQLDLLHLCRWPLVARLSHLDLSTNLLPTAALCSLLHAARSLRSVRLDGCGLRDADLERVAAAAASVASLSLDRNPWHSVAQFGAALLGTVARAASLRRLCVSLPNEVHVRLVDATLHRVYLLARRECVDNAAALRRRLSAAFHEQRRNEGLQPVQLLLTVPVDSYGSMSVEFSIN